MHKIRVAVLRGGPSSEYEVSLKTGATILSHMPGHYHPIDILIDKQGVWHQNGIPVEPHQVLKHVDAVVVAMHGQYGEDGKVQRLLETFGVPFTGSDSLGSALGMNKDISKKIFKQHGIKTPYHELANIPGSIEHQALELFRKFSMPVVVKPVSAGSSVGVTIAKNIGELEAGLRKAYEHGDQAMVEEFIQGKEATCGVVDDFRGQSTYPLFPTEIVPQSAVFYDYDAKYADGGSVHICPGNFSEEEKKAIQDAAVLAHKALNLRHYSRSDFMVHPKRGVYILEVNTLPGFTETSLLPQSLQAVGCSIGDFLDHVIKLAMNSR
jgi:D-alanine-D-alanine ligase